MTTFSNGRHAYGGRQGNSRGQRTLSKLSSDFIAIDLGRLEALLAGEAPPPAKPKRTKTRRRRPVER